ncbi:MAG: CBS domain-containing protein [Calditrichia bacterium]
MKTIREILDKKGHQIWSVSPDTKIFEALQLMAEKNIGALVVLDGDKLVGIISERDYARKVALKGKTSKETPIRDIMTPKVLYVTPEKTAEDCMALMIEKRIRHLPVYEQDKLIGVVSIGDVVKAVIEEKKIAIEHLENYITLRR